MKKLVCLLLTLAMVLSVVACAATPEPAVAAEPQAEPAAEAAPAAQEAAPEAAAAEEPVTISFKHFYVPDGDEVLDKAVIAAKEEFLASHPNVTIDEEYMSHDAYSEKMLTLSAAGNLPDLFYVKGSWLDGFIANGSVEPMDGYLEADAAWKDSFLSGAFDEFTRDGKVYGVPHYISYNGVCYINNTIWNECGLTYPATWDELIADLQIIKDKGYTALLMGNQEAWPAECALLSSVAGRFTGDDWTWSIAKKDPNASFDNPDFIAALNAVVQLTQFMNPDYNSLSVKQARMNFAEGKAAMYVNTDFCMDFIVKNSTDELKSNISYTVLPEIPGQKGAAGSTSGTVGWAWAINPYASDEVKAACLDLIKCLTSEAAGKATYAAGVIPCYDCEYNESEVDVAFVDYLSSITAYPMCPVYDIVWDQAIIDVLNSDLQLVMAGSMKPEAMASDLQAAYQKVLAG